MQMATRGAGVHALFAIASGLLGAQVYLFVVEGSRSIDRMAAPLMALGLWLVVVSIVYTSRAWHKRLVAAVGVGLLIVSTVFRLTA
jgi:hypothetical protein